MKRDSLVYLISGTFFGVLVGWILGSQQAGPAAPAAAALSAPGTAPGAATGDPAPPPLDVQRASALEKTATSQPANAAVRTDLGNLYYDAQRFDLAVPWYEAAQKINPKDTDVSTDLAVCYFYTKDFDRALSQIDHSLSVEPKSTKALLNQGIIRAYGKENLAAATESWQKVIDLAPTSADGIRAKELIDGVKANHPGAGGAGRGGGAPDFPPAPAEFG